MSSVSTPDDVPLVVEGRAAAATGRGVQVRKAARLSREDFAVLIGVSVMTLRRWETGEQLPTGQRAVAYTRALRQIAGEVAIHG